MLSMPCNGWQCTVMLLEHLGYEVKGFQHRSAGSEREIIQLIAKVIQDEIVDQVKCTLVSEWMT